MTEKPERPNRSNVQPPAVIFVDDEPFYADPFIKRLGRDFSVYFYRDANAANAAFGEIEGPAYIVVDIMMPPPGLDLNFETDYGQVTGLWLLSIHRERLKQLNTPIMVITNKDLDLVDVYLREMEIKDLNLKVMAKFAVSPDFLAQEILRSITTEKP